MDAPRPIKLALFVLTALIIGSMSTLVSCGPPKKTVAYIWPSLGERVQNLEVLSNRKPVISLNAEKFKTYIGARGHGQPVRNYTMVVMFTVLSSRRQCPMCRAAADEFAIVARSWRQSPTYEPKLFFASVDFDNAGEVFNQLGLESVPVYLLFPPRTTKVGVFSAKHTESMPIDRVGFAAETISRWVGAKAGVNIVVIRPAEFMITILLSALIIVALPCLYFYRAHFRFLTNNKFLAFVALALVFTMISGHMWCHIRRPPIMGKGGRSEAFIRASSSEQFQVETYIVFGLYVGTTLGFVLLIEAMKISKPSKRSFLLKAGRKVAAVIGLVMIGIFFSLLLSVFRQKAGGYPYRLFIE